jgi:hypothetical protein
LRSYCQQEVWQWTVLQWKQLLRFGSGLLRCGELVPEQVGTLQLRVLRGVVMEDKDDWGCHERRMLLEDY